MLQCLEMCTKLMIYPTFLLKYVVLNLIFGTTVKIPKCLKPVFIAVSNLNLKMLGLCSKVADKWQTK